jgi:hypothetical protein
VSSQFVPHLPQKQDQSQVTPRRFVVTLFTAAVVVVLLILQSLSSEAADSRVAPVVLNSDTTIAATLNVVVGARVEFELTLTNNSSRRVEVQFPSGRTHDFAVIDSAGREVWRWSTGKMFTQVMRNRSIDAHESISFSTSWKNPDAVGTFTAVARLWSRNFPLEERAEIIIR